MEAYKATIIFVLAILSATSALHKLVPKGKELVYDYEAEVKAVTRIPVPYESNFFLFGQLSVVQMTNSTVLRLVDLKYQLSNGEKTNYRDSSVVLTLPQELQDLQNAFRVIYDENGRTIGIVTNAKESEYVRNIKRAIASTLQLDVTDISLKTEVPHTFETFEQSIYGNGTVQYTVIPREDRLVVEKVQDWEALGDTDNIYFQSNLIPNWDTDVSEEVLTRDAQTVYNIVKYEGQEVVDKIEATGGVYMQQWEGKSEAHYVYTRQIFNLRTVKDANEVPQIEKQLYEDDISYNLFNFDDKLGPVPDMTNGRRTINYNEVVPVVNQMVEEIVTYLKENHIHTKQPNIKNGQLINRIVRVLIVLDVPSLEKVYNAVIGKQPQEVVVQQLLPLIGSRASLTFIRNLVQQKKVKDSVACNLLQNLPFHVKNPSGDLLTELEPLINLPEDVSPSVRRSAVLAFASLILQTNTRLNQLEFYESSTEKQAIVEAQITKVREQLNKYVEVFVKRLKNTTVHDERVLYLQALRNTRLTSIVEYLLPAVKGEWWNNRHLRALALWTVYPAVVKDPTAVQEIYWPILVDSRLHTELRIIAYYILMETAPNLTRMINISWLLNAENNHELYQFHYTYLRSVSQTTEPSRQELRLRAAQVLKYTYVPNLYGMTGYHQIDYVDPEYSFGGIIKTMTILTDKTIVFNTAIRYHMMTMSVNDCNLHVRIHGLENLNKPQWITKDNTFNTEGLVNIFQQITTNKDIQIEVILMKKGQVYNTITYDASNPSALQEIMSLLTKEEDDPIERDLEIDFVTQMTTILPTAVGFPALIKTSVPMVIQSEQRFLQDIADQVFNWKFDNKLQLWANDYSGVSFYNPIVDVFQGAARFTSVNFLLPLKFEINYNHPQRTFKFVLLRNEKAEEDVIGLRYHTTSMVYVKDDFQTGILKKSSPKDEEFVVVSKGADYRKEVTVVDEQLKNWGYRLNTVVYDSEYPVSNAQIQSTILKRWAPENKNYRTLLEHVALSLTNIDSLFFFTPKPGTKGLMVKLTQNPEAPVTSNEFIVRLNRDVKHEDNVLLPAVKWNGKVTYAVKNGENVLSTYDMNAIVDVPSGHNIYNVKAQFTRLVTGQKEVKACLEGSQKWTKDGVNGKWTVGINQNGDAKCTKDAVMDITLVGEKSEEQQREYVTYAACEETGVTNHSLHQYVPCYEAHSSIRKYVYTIQHKNVPTDVQQYLERLVNDMTNRYSSSKIMIEEQNEKLDSQQIRVELRYPMNSENIQLNVETPNQKYIGYLSSELRCVGLRPGNTQFSRAYLMLHAFGLIKQCIVTPYSLKIKNNLINYQVPKEWTMLVGDGEQTVTNGVYVKQIEGNQLAVKMVVKSNTIEIVPQGVDYQITINGQKVTNQELTEDWVYYNRLPGTRNMVIIGRQVGTHIYYDGQHAHVEVPNTKVQLYGQCLQQ